MISKMLPFLGLCMLLGGCMGSSAPTSYYTLSCVTPDAPLNDPAESDLTIGIGPVELPAYLDRASIVTRSGPHRLRIDDNQRWAGPLQEEIMRVLKRNLAVRTGAVQVATYPWHHDSAPTLQVRLNVLFFEGDGRNVVLDARWDLIDTATSETLDSRHTPIKTPISGDDTESMVAAMSKTLDNLGEKIAVAIIESYRGR